MSRQPTVFLVDPDGATREAIKKLTSLMDLHCEAFASGQDFLAACDPTSPGCVVMEVKVPGINGLQIQQRLREQGITLPVIFHQCGTKRVDRRPRHAVRAAAFSGESGPRK